jgi:hypothetical protein
VDFPKVKADLKRQIMARIDDGARQSSNPFAALGSALAGALADPAIDALVTSENVARLLSGEEFGRAGRSGVEFDDDSLTMGYDGLNRFVVTTNAENGFTLVLERDGALTWKLTQVLLPASFSLPSMAPAATATTGPR